MTQCSRTELPERVAWEAQEAALNGRALIQFLALVMAVVVLTLGCSRIGARTNANSQLGGYSALPENDFAIKTGPKRDLALLELEREYCTGTCISTGKAWLQKGYSVPLGQCEVALRSLNASAQFGMQAPVLFSAVVQRDARNDTVLRVYGENWNRETCRVIVSYVGTRGEIAFGTLDRAMTEKDLDMRFILDVRLEPVSFERLRDLCRIDENGILTAHVSEGIVFPYVESATSFLVAIEDRNGMRSSFIPAFVADGSGN